MALQYTTSSALMPEVLQAVGHVGCCPMLGLCCFWPLPFLLLRMLLWTIFALASVQEILALKAGLQIPDRVNQR